MVNGEKRRKRNFGGKRGDEMKEYSKGCSFVDNFCSVKSSLTLTLTLTHPTDGRIHTDLLLLL